MAESSQDTYTESSADVSRLKLHVSKVDVVDYLKLDHTRCIHGQDITKQGRGPPGYSIQKSSSKVEGTQSKSSDAVSGLAKSDIEASWNDQPSKALAARMPASSRSPRLDEMVSVCAGKRSEYSHIRVEASVLSLQQCDRFCLCQCHKVTNLATPNPLGKLIGRLFIGYIGLPFLSHRTCSRITCRRGKSQMRLRIAYLFPLWFALRLIALTITKASTTFSCTLSFPAVTQTSCPMLVLTSLGSIEKVQGLLATNAAVLNAVDVMASKSPLHVGTAIDDWDGETKY